MARTLRGEEQFPLTCGRYGVAISWDQSAGSSVDVDLQAVIVDNGGQIIDAVYFNNLKAMKCITHSGDETTGEKAGLDECVWLTISKMPEKVKMIVFVVAAFRGGHLRDACNGKIHVLEERAENEVARFDMEKSEENVDVVALMIKDGSQWVLKLVDEDASSGSHFIDVVEPTIGNIIRGQIPGAPRRMKVAFAMEKGSVVDFSQADSVGRVTAGLGWDTGKGDVDLDVSAVLLDGSGKDRNTVFFGNLEADGLKHSGDNLTGEGDGDDETIEVDLQRVPEWAVQIFFVVNIYSKGKTFSEVSNPYCRMIGSEGGEIARYELKEAGRQNGLIIARLFRDAPGGRWAFQAVGSFCHGQTWKDSVPEIVAVSRKKPQDLQLRGAATMALQGEPQVASRPAPAANPAPPPQSSACCTLQ